MVDRNRPARFEIGERASLKATGQPVEIMEVRRAEFIPDFVYKVRVLGEARPALQPLRPRTRPRGRSRAERLGLPGYGHSPEVTFR